MYKLLLDSYCNSNGKNNVRHYFVNNIMFSGPR